MQQKAQEQPQRYVPQLLAPATTVTCYIPEPNAPWQIYLPAELLTDATQWYHLALSHIDSRHLLDPYRCISMLLDFNNRLKTLPDNATLANDTRTLVALMANWQPAKQLSLPGVKLQSIPLAPGLNKLAINKLSSKRSPSSTRLPTSLSWYVLTMAQPLMLLCSLKIHGSHNILVLTWSFMTQAKNSLAFIFNKCYKGMELTLDLLQSRIHKPM